MTQGNLGRGPPDRPSRHNPVVFDSSFLMAVSRRPTTWFEDITEAIGKFEPFMPDCVRKELERLAARQGSRSRLARVALELGSLFAGTPCGRGSVDDEIVSKALSMKARVATADASLAASLRAAGAQVITLRSGRVHVI